MAAGVSPIALCGVSCDSGLPRGSLPEGVGVPSDQ